MVFIETLPTFMTIKPQSQLITKETHTQTHTWLLLFLHSLIMVYVVLFQWMVEIILKRFMCGEEIRIDLSFSKLFEVFGEIQNFDISIPKSLDVDRLRGSGKNGRHDLFNQKIKIKFNLQWKKFILVIKNCKFYDLELYL